jgi:hypothetical protein
MLTLILIPIFHDNRMDFYESCIDQLKKDLPKYLKHHSGKFIFNNSLSLSRPDDLSISLPLSLSRSLSNPNLNPNLDPTETNKTSKLIQKILRNAASAESNKELQNSFFLQAQKYEQLDIERVIYYDTLDFFIESLLYFLL